MFADFVSNNIDVFVGLISVIAQTPNHVKPLKSWADSIRPYEKNRRPPSAADFSHCVGF
ncbi:MAG: hypothetical protein FWG65_04270 [Turicibacter sp.]|nr:hypothetical protein [Turicibacter sp.]